ncbi:DNA gyrase subunit A [Salisediminibacterium halotolerans]|uniref:DNA gyrase subunit A n=1 Tax=Salisediminibacterium halotolerans TaxID=517425 RepID=UPI000EB2EB67|nr:DNA gyrase subunit A [Salisediminibacterium halotolerans]RLJ69744.1 DNA gyrase subunit A [Actinophytocola xinjiangensis]RPE89802.1 DNA gyrase subunit A [Salisediminibacterium halotolerans]TWG32638.1 DNA gyrase subunit A [Salisediminibacterium halotolerans]GEL07550.1 DNA gyrase subunit A [Salisediminibacterium halotolerans]
MSESDQSRVREININQEMKTSFMDYAMSVIVSRALPDVRDGLKPVHRRILYAMNELGITADKSYKKSARIVGEVIGKYHPHGDSAVYEAMVRMAQDFSYRYMLVDGHGNFGSVDGDAAAAMRYTEARMSKISMEMVRDINKDTISYQENYDGAENEPVVLPARFPNLLINGASGIAVGMATNIPPHNLSEVIAGVLALSRNPEITVEELMEYISGPDFPTGAEIVGISGIRRAYETGKGSIMVRANAEIEEVNGKPRIIVDELPYQVNKARLIEKIAELVRDKKIDGITDLRDESDRTGMRIVIELRRDVNANVLLNNLFKQTALQTSFGINTLALVDGRPKVLTLKESLYHYLEHQKVVIRRRTEFDLKKAEARAHILEGLRVALDYLDQVIELIRGSQTSDIARQGLMENYDLSHDQAQAILDMRLNRLTGLERDKIENEYSELVERIRELKAILADEERILEIIRNELTELRDKYGDDRRTTITFGEDSMEDEDLIPRQNVVITVSHQGYIKRLPVSTYRSQKRGGRGVQGMGTYDDDFVRHLFVTNSHNHLLFFTNKGKVYRIKAYEVPEQKRTSKGTPIINLLQIDQDEYISAVIPISDFDPDQSLFFMTKYGVSKRTDLAAFKNIRRGGLFAIKLREGDELHGVRLTDGTKELVIGTKQGLSIRFNENDVRLMGRTATGVKGLNLKANDEVVGMDICQPDQDILIVTENGFGKRTKADEYRLQTRGGKGIKTCNVTEKNGELVALKVVSEEHDLMVITTNGVVIRMHVDEISQTSRNTQGVRLIRLGDEEYVSTVARVNITEDEDEDEDETAVIAEAGEPAAEETEGSEEIASDDNDEDED